jgi:polyribonucleotide nucleotidyltransferase
MPEPGERYLGTVVKTTTFGAFVSLMPGKDGLLHISEVRKLVGGQRINAVEDVLQVGQKVQVEIKEVDPAASSRWPRCSMTPMGPTLPELSTTD